MANWPRFWAGRIVSGRSEVRHVDQPDAQSPVSAVPVSLALLVRLSRLIYWPIRLIYWPIARVKRARILRCGAKISIGEASPSGFTGPDPRVHDRTRDEQLG